jgi:hypothetical protein
MTRVVRRLLATRNQPWVLIALMFLDLAINSAATKQQLEAHFDQLRVGPVTRQAIIPVKVAGTIGLLVGRRWPRLGALTAALWVVYFALATGYHRRVKDGPIVTAPALIYGGVAARALITDLERSGVFQRA